MVEMRAPTTSRSGRGVRLCALAAFAAVSLGTTLAEARRRGIISADCVGCHGSEGAAVEITASPAAFAPGDDVTFTVAVRRLQGEAAVGGVSISQPATGELRALAGEGLTLVAGSGLTHSQPKPAVAGVATFRFAWRAPAEPGGIVFDVGALAGNGDGRTSGDVAGMARYLATFGCDPALHYPDLDRDGHGTELFEPAIGCAGAVVPPGFATVADDCNDNDAAVFPSAVEKCNKKDDDCDAEVDEEAELVELWPDEDGDGYYRTQTGTPVIGCSGMSGYAAEPGDCAPNDPAVNPGATEVCNLIDDNCDGRPDDRLRPQCGEGFCRRESYDCDPAHCTPGEPRPERCNYLDDDCNGEVDEGDELCAAGSACLAGKCVVTGETGGTAGGAGAGSGGAPTSGAGGQGESGGATGGNAVGTGGGVMTAGAGGDTGNLGSGGTGSGGNGGADAVPVTTNTSSGCVVGARTEPAGGWGAALLAFVLVAFRLGRRRSH
jgi:hypothetical protein